MKIELSIISPIAMLNLGHFSTRVPANQTTGPTGPRTACPRGFRSSNRSNRSADRLAWQVASFTAFKLGFLFGMSESACF